MQRDLLLNIQRKVLGGYINAEEFSINGSGKEILSTMLDESLFDDFMHRAVARACIKLKNNNIPVSDFTVLDFLNKHNIPKGSYQESEYITLMSEYAITPATFNHYISMIIQHKMEN